MRTVITQPIDADNPTSIASKRLNVARRANTSVIRTGDVLNAVWICLAILIAALIAFPECRHWFVIPLFCCGVICCLDGLRLFEGNGRELFDPVPMLGAFGLYFFYIAPLLHVGLDYWFITSTFSPSGQPDDWRTWLGWMALINLGGLILYKGCQRRLTSRFLKRCPSTWYSMNRGSLQFWGPIVLGISLLAQVYIYLQFRGIGGFIEAFSSSRADAPEFQGLGWIMCIAESFPILLLIAWAAHSRKWGILNVGVVLSLLFALILVFGGLRGSRGNTVFAILYAVGIIHLTLYRLTWRPLGMLVILLVAFMYIYGFYKVSEQTFVDATSSLDSMAYEGERNGRTLDAVLLGDMDRADIQAYTLFQVMQDGRDAEYGYGRTYTDAVVDFVPHAILPDRPPGKVKYGTDLFFGNGTYSPEGFGSSKIYGLAGEAMLNWGLLGIVPCFIVFGAIVGWLQAFVRRLHPADSRRYLAPILSIACIVALSSDFDNVLYVLLRHALMPAILIWLCSTRVKAAANI